MLTAPRQSIMNGHGFEPDKAYFKVLSWHASGVTEKITKTSVSVLVAETKSVILAMNYSNCEGSHEPAARDTLPCVTTSLQLPGLRVQRPLTETDVIISH